MMTKESNKNDAGVVADVISTIMTEVESYSSLCKQPGFIDPKCSVIVSELNKDVHGNLLWRYFSQFGLLKSIQRYLSSDTIVVTFTKEAAVNTLLYTYSNGSQTIELSPYRIHVRLVAQYHVTFTWEDMIRLKYGRRHRHTSFWKNKQLRIYKWHQVKNSCGNKLRSLLQTFDGFSSLAIQEASIQTVFNSEAAVDAIMLKLRPLQLNGLWWCVQRTNPLLCFNKVDSKPSTMLSVLPAVELHCVTEQNIRSAFEAFGNISWIKSPEQKLVKHCFPPPPTDKVPDIQHDLSAGFTVINFTDYDAVDKALNVGHRVSIQKRSYYIQKTFTTEDAKFITKLLQNKYDTSNSEITPGTSDTKPPVVDLTQDEPTVSAPAVIPVQARNHRFSWNSTGSLEILRQQQQQHQQNDHQLEGLPYGIEQLSEPCSSNMTMPNSSSVPNPSDYMNIDIFSGRAQNCCSEEQLHHQLQAKNITLPKARNCRVLLYNATTVAAKMSNSRIPHPRSSGPGARVRKPKDQGCDDTTRASRFFGYQGSEPSPPLQQQQHGLTCFTSPNFSDCLGVSSTSGDVPRVQPSAEQQQQQQQYTSVGPIRSFPVVRPSLQKETGMTELLTAESSCGAKPLDFYGQPVYSDNVQQYNSETVGRQASRSDSLVQGSALQTQLSSSSTSIDSSVFCGGNTFQVIYPGSTLPSMQRTCRIDSEIPDKHNQLAHRPPTTGTLPISSKAHIHRCKRGRQSGSANEIPLALHYKKTRIMKANERAAKRMNTRYFDASVIRDSPEFSNVGAVPSRRHMLQRGRIQMKNGRRRFRQKSHSPLLSPDNQFSDMSELSPNYTAVHRHSRKKHYSPSPASALNVGLSTRCRTRSPSVVSSSDISTDLSRHSSSHPSPSPRRSDRSRSRSRSVSSMSGQRFKQGRSDQRKYHSPNKYLHRGKKSTGNSRAPRTAKKNALYKGNTSNRSSSASSTSSLVSNSKYASPKSKKSRDHDVIMSPLYASLQALGEKLSAVKQKLAEDAFTSTDSESGKRKRRKTKRTQKRDGKNSKRRSRRRNHTNSSSDIMDLELPEPTRATLYEQQHPRHNIHSSHRRAVMSHSKDSHRSSSPETHPKRHRKCISPEQPEVSTNTASRIFKRKQKKMKKSLDCLSDSDAVFSMNAMVGIGSKMHEPRNPQRDDDVMVLNDDKDAVQALALTHQADRHRCKGSAVSRGNHQQSQVGNKHRSSSCRPGKEDTNWDSNAVLTVLDQIMDSKRVCGAVELLSPDDIARLLSAADVDKSTVDTLRNENLTDMAVFPHLNNEDFQEIGIPILHRKQIMGLIDLLKAK